MTTKGTKKRKRDEISSEFEIANDLKKIKMNTNKKDSEKKKFSSISIKIPKKQDKNFKGKTDFQKLHFFKVKSLFTGVWMSDCLSQFVAKMQDQTRKKYFPNAY